METEKELVLLKEYMGYFIDLKYTKTVHLTRLKDWDEHGPKPRLNFRNEKNIEPLSFKDWIKYYGATKD